MFLKKGLFGLAHLPVGLHVCWLLALFREQNWSLTCLYLQQNQIWLLQLVFNLCKLLAMHYKYYEEKVMMGKLGMDWSGQWLLNNWTSILLPSWVTSFAGSTFERSELTPLSAGTHYKKSVCPRLAFHCIFEQPGTYLCALSWSFGFKFCDKKVSEHYTPLFSFTTSADEGHLLFLLRDALLCSQLLFGADQTSIKWGDPWTYKAEGKHNWYPDVIVLLCIHCYTHSLIFHDALPLCIIALN